MRPNCSNNKTCFRQSPVELIQLCVWVLVILVILVMNGALPAGDSDVTALVDVAGALPSQLQGHWGEVAGCSFHHQFTHCAASCVEDVIKPEFQQLLGL